MMTKIFLLFLSYKDNLKPITVHKLPKCFFFIVNFQILHTYTHIAQLYDNSHNAIPSTTNFFQERHTCLSLTSISSICILILKTCITLLNFFYRLRVIILIVSNTSNPSVSEMITLLLK